MEFSTGEKIGLATLAGFVVLIFALIAMILIGIDGLVAWRETAIDLVFETADRIRETLFPVE